MATAIILGYNSVIKDDAQGGKLLLKAQVIFVGNDVPGNYYVYDGSLDLTGITTAAGLNTAIATALRGFATANGLTIPANAIFFPAWSNE